MDSMTAILNGEMNRGKEPMVFDWDKAARLIMDRKAKLASAGLAGDWEYTGGRIWNGKIITKSYTYLSSTWAKPQIDIDGHIEDCYLMEHEAPGWDCDTKWPDSAMAIISAE